MTPVGMPYDLKAKCNWAGDLLHIELPETPKAIHVHHPCGSTFFGVPTGVEQELRSENAELRELVKHLNTCNFYTSIECADIHCWECPYDNSTGNCDFDKRMCELGIEVDECQRTSTT